MLVLESGRTWFPTVPRGRGLRRPAACWIRVRGRRLAWRLPSRFDCQSAPAFLYTAGLDACAGLRRRLASVRRTRRFTDLQDRRTTVNGVMLGTGGFHPNEARHTAGILLPGSGVLLDAGT